jgi:hypothetical protein
MRGYQAINPYYVPLLSLAVMSIAFFYPNDAWQAIFSEPNLAYLNTLYVTIMLAYRGGNVSLF